MPKKFPRFLGQFLRQFWLGAALGAAIMAVPLAPEKSFWFEGLRQGVGAFVIVASIGKALYDSLFYDRYQR